MNVKQDAQRWKNADASAPHVVQAYKFSDASLSLASLIRALSHTCHIATISIRCDIHVVATFGEFEWDDEKAISNLAKHGVSFEEAASAFDDERNVVLADPQGHEDRFVLLGKSRRSRILFIVHVEVTQARRIRIVSARLANKRERSRYSEG